MEIILLIISALAIIGLLSAIKIVPQQEAWVMEKLGKFDRVMEPGLNIIIPIIQRIAYKHTLKEQAIDVHEQTAISNDNVTLTIDGVLYVKVIDPKVASYGVSDPYYAVAQLAQTTMRSEIGKLKLDKTFEEREILNHAIVTTINEAAVNWGIQCMRYEIKDIQPPRTILKAMEMEVAAERQKRAEILESEGKRQSLINKAEGEKAQVVLNSEASLTDQVNRAKGEAEAIICVADATAKGIDILAKSINKAGGTEAVSLKVAEQYVEAFSKLAKESNTILLPANIDNPSGIIAQAMTIYDNLGEGKEVSLVGFGNFSVADVPARAGRNPRTGLISYIGSAKADTKISSDCVYYGEEKLDNGNKELKEMTKRGKVKWYSEEKGFGVITPDNGGIDAFVSASQVQAAETQRLKQVVSKIEAIEQERLDNAELLKDAYNEAKALGFDVKIIKYVLKLKKKDKDALAEEINIFYYLDSTLSRDYE
ncbi:stomatin-like protein 2, mitochondrial, partial [Stylophora pistillata]|uniref:stomatin-like protein 2, mitochondrial n=1 Tax=Stylophora pistillata TaxID=50429 RepID=UPI000C039B4E